MEVGENHLKGVFTLGFALIFKLFTCVNKYYSYLTWNRNVLLKKGMSSLHIFKTECVLERELQ